MRFDIPPDASEDEAAAIAAVVRAYVAESTDEAETDDEAWRERRWRFAGRVDALQGRRIRPATDAPTDPWAAAGRTSRMQHR